MKQEKAAMVERPRLVGTAKLAARLGISRSHLYQVTRGMRKPSPRVAARLRRLGIECPALAKEGGQA